MLIESNQRGRSLQLVYSDELLSVPKNVYIIGLMNTSDRSLAMLDFALRRRFAFFELKPAFQSEGFIKYRQSQHNVVFDKVITVIEALNEAIQADAALGKGYLIGHSFFCSEDEVSSQWLGDVVDYEIIPLLNEYWFDDPSKVTLWEAKLKKVLG